MANKISSQGLGNGRGLMQDVQAPVAALTEQPYALPFFHYLAIPKNTDRLAPVAYALNLPIGTIDKLWLEFPRGCSGLAGIQIHRDVRQLFPLPEGVWLRSDNSVLNFRFSHAIANEPYEVVLKGYNDDDTYQHTIWFGFEMSGQQADLSPQLQALITELKRA